MGEDANASSADGGEAAADEKLDLELLAQLFLVIGATYDDENCLEALEQISDIVNAAFGEDGAAAGALARVCGGVEILAGLLTSQSLALQQECLVLLGNLCSNAVDPLSGETKTILFRAQGAVEGLFRCMDSRETSVVMCACGALQNLCHDQQWAEAADELGARTRLEELTSHSDATLVRYAAGALKNMAARLNLKNMVARLNVAGNVPDDQSSGNMTEKVLDEFREKRARRIITAAARGIQPEYRMRRCLASTNPTAAKAQAGAVEQVRPRPAWSTPDPRVSGSNAIPYRTLPVFSPHTSVYDNHALPYLTLLGLLPTPGYEAITPSPIDSPPPYLHATAFYERLQHLR